MLTVEQVLGISLPIITQAYGIQKNLNYFMHTLHFQMINGKKHLVLSIQLLTQKIF